MLYSHILVPTDFFLQRPNATLVYACEEATQHQAKLTLLHVLRHHSVTQGLLHHRRAAEPYWLCGEFGEKLPAFPSQPPEAVRRDYYEEALVQLHALVPASFTGAWEVQVAAGHPAETIVRTARELAVDSDHYGNAWTHGCVTHPAGECGGTSESVMHPVRY